MSRKILVSCLLGFFLIYLQSASLVKAEVTITATPSQFPAQTTTGVAIRVSNLLPSHSYSFKVRKDGGQLSDIIVPDIRFDSDASGNLGVTPALILCPNGNVSAFSLSSSCNKVFQTGTYTISINEYGKDTLNGQTAPTTSFTVIGSTIGISFSKNPLTTQDSNGVTMNATGLIPSAQYKFYLNGQYLNTRNGSSINPTDYSPDTSGNLSFLLCPDYANNIYIQQDNQCSNAFQQGNYAVTIKQNGDEISSGTSLSVSSETSTTLNFTNTSFTPKDNIQISASGLVPTNWYKILVNDQDPERGKQCLFAEDGNLTAELGNYYNGGPYVVKVVRSNATCTVYNTVAVEGSFCISDDPENKCVGQSEPVGTVIEPTPNPNTSAPSCKHYGDPGYSDLNSPPPDACSSAAGKPCANGGIDTAIGCIPTNPVDFVKGIIRLAIGLGGGVALLLMILGSFELITSAGNPDRVKEGQSRFTNAVIGLLFIIFAVLLMRLIGVDILGLGGYLGVAPK